MVTSLKCVKDWGRRLMIAGSLCLLVPAHVLAVNVTGRVVPLDEANNQPTLKIQISGTFRPGIKSGWFDNDNWRITAAIPWTQADANPPPYTEADGWGNFNLPIYIDPRGDMGGQTQMDPPLSSLDKESETNGLNGNGIGVLGQEFDTSFRPTLRYSLSAGYDGNYAEFDLDLKHRYSDEFALEGKFTIPNYVNNIDWWIEGVDLFQAGQKFEQSTGNTVTGWEKYFGDGVHKPWLSTAWAPPKNEIRKNFIWDGGVKDQWSGSENNAVTNTAPAQGLYPHTWPVDEEATPVATVYFRRSNHE